MQVVYDNTFLIYWHKAMIGAAFIMLAAAVIAFVRYKIRLASIHDLKDKYDYVNTNEVKVYKTISVLISISVLFTINIYGMNEIKEIGVWFFVRLFMSIAGGTTITYVAVLVLDFYYPKLVYKKLTAWRYTPRINPKNGNKMRLLREDEEDVHLDKGMLAEESVFSVDYDVWIDDETAEIKIEKYPGYLQVLQCNSCGFYTMRVVKEIVSQQPTLDSPGELIKHYQCTYCNSIRATAFKISTKEKEDYLKTPSTLNKVRKVNFVRLEIHSNDSNKEFFEFQNIEQVQRFLREYEEKKERESQESASSN